MKCKMCGAKFWDFFALANHMFSWHRKSMTGAMNFWVRKRYASIVRREARLLVSGHLVPENRIHRAILLTGLFRNPSR